MKKTTLVLIILLTFLFQGFSDTVELKNGDTITGTIIEMNENSIIIKTQYGTQRVPKNIIVVGVFLGDGNKDKEQSKRNHDEINIPKIPKLPKTIEGTIRSAAYDKKHKIIYILDKEKILRYRLQNGLQWEHVADMPEVARYYGGMVILHDNLIIPPGVSKGGWGRQHSIIIYDIKDNAFRKKDMGVGRIWNSCIGIFNEKIYIFGGHNGRDLKYIWEWDVRNNRFLKRSETLSKPLSNENASSVILHNNKFYILGHKHPGYHLRFMTVDPITLNSRVGDQGLINILEGDNSFYGGSFVKDKYIYYHGFQRNDDIPISFRFDTSKNTFEKIPNILPNKELRFSPCSLQIDNMFVIIGGSVIKNDKGSSTNEVSVYPISKLNLPD